MRGFIVLCLCSVALAAPQGYNYNPAQQQQMASFGATIVGGGSSGGYYQGQQGGQQLQQTSSAGFFQPSFGGQQQGQVQQQFQQQQQQQQQQAIISKRFFIHTAPEDTEEDYKEKLITVGVPKKNYNVVFIKAPARSQKKTAIKISPAVNEEKTVIYVLSKKTDSSDLQAEVIETPQPTAKPEVFFIKYKTQEEAAHAQQQIQSQYDALGGSSQVTDEGVIPVTSVIGSLGGGDAGHDNSGSSISTSSVGHSGSGSLVSSGFSSSGSTTLGSGGSSLTSGATHNAYLPPNFY